MDIQLRSYAIKKRSSYIMASTIWQNNTNLEMYYKELSIDNNISGIAYGLQIVAHTNTLSQLQDLSNVGWKWVFVIKEELNHENFAYKKHILMHYHRKLRAFVYIDRKRMVCYSYISSQ